LLESLTGQAVAHNAHKLLLHVLMLNTVISFTCTDV